MKDQSFEISGVFHEQVADKLPIIELEDWLNLHFTLSSYGPGVQHLFLLFMAVPEAESNLHNDLMYDEQEALLQISLRLPYEQVLNSSSDTARRMMLEALVEALESLTPQAGMEAFDWERLAADVREAMG